MPRKGRLLEILVKHFEQTLAPEGVKVESPEEFYKGGKKIGEMDITLRGNFGSSSIFVGIECRDRPNDGVQGIDWITQIKGKQQLLHVDKMIAVSSTGFSQQAIDAAHEFNIDLINFEDINNVNLENWFTTATFIYIDSRFQILEGARIETENKSGDISRLGIEMNSPILEFVPGEKRYSMEEFIAPQVETLFKEIKILPNEPPLQVELEVNSPFKIVSDGSQFQVVKMTIPVEIWQDAIEAKVLLNAYKKPDQNDVMALGGICEIQTRTQKLKVLLVANKNIKDFNLTDLRVYFLTEDYKPHVVPAGSSLTVLSLKLASDANLRLILGNLNGYETNN
jgi:hypothetical protein